MIISVVPVLPAVPAVSTATNATTLQQVAVQPPVLQSTLSSQLNVNTLTRMIDKEIKERQRTRETSAESMRHQSCGK